jgi:hypothetical protein
MFFSSDYIISVVIILYLRGAKIGKIFQYTNRSRVKKLFFFFLPYIKGGEKNLSNLCKKSFVLSEKGSIFAPAI